MIPKIEARSIGPIAEQALKPGADATVIASFRRSFYLQSDDRIICVADDGLYDGPINVLVQTIGPISFWTDCPPAVGQRWAIGGRSLSAIDGSGINIDLGAKPIWRPKPPSKVLSDRRQFRLALTRLKTLAASRGPSEDLLSCVLSSRTQSNAALEQAAAKALQDLSQDLLVWLEDGDCRIMASLEALLGLGPGLTPSGDDLIAGLLIACGYIDRRQQASDLWHQLEARARRCTTPISFAHLSAAGQGLGAAPFHKLIDALVENNTKQLPVALDVVAGIGHSSGLDAVGGLILLLDAWVEAADDRMMSAA